MSSIKSQYELVIGLEVHAQLLTESKIFAADANQFGSLPNRNISVITLGHPGTLPKLNAKAVELAVRFGLATNSQIARRTVFDRKNYFYPDLPKGYQISQDKHPICIGGEIWIKGKDGQEKAIPMHHTHLEEDAGKSIHDEHSSDTLLDYNRAGTPLIEIVSDPSMRSAEEAGAYLTEVRKLVRYLDICDGNMEEGSLRCDANISVRKFGDPVLGTKVEVKNMNSVRFLQKAIEYEYERQVAMVEAGETIIQETRMFDPETGRTYGMRVKETMNDYRYFPEPDLVPILITDEQLESIRSQMPTLPRQLVQTYTTQYGLSEADALSLTESKATVAYLEALIAAGTTPKAAANWLMGSVRTWMNESKQDLTEFPLTPQTLAALIQLVEENKVSHSAAAQKLFPALIETPDVSPLALAERLQLLQQGNSDVLQALIDEVLQAWPDKVKEYKKGKKGLIGLFVGEVMKKSKGQADPKVTNQLVAQSLDASTL
ncbi:Asp-tRNA(Asn)/Glu-tRNA(Gln) amidotransferase subunit GatB [Siphonobacter sp.]|uniref:Asp-tRNA(Asn)/Glu-tRNA(Gln) amidotransferase subunit GatB n=1 Tax=Siphonobacter sp. TaxID=1869184 RepID=UPI003B3A7E02